MARHSNSPTAEEKLMAYIYDDVDDSDIFAFKPLQDPSDSGDDKVVSSEQHLELINENKDLKVKVKMLEEKANLLELRLSELYKTAKAEIERKDNRIRELNEAKDDILFRRNRGANKYYKGTNDVHQYNHTSHREKSKSRDTDEQIKNVKKDDVKLEKLRSSSSSRNEKIEEPKGREEDKKPSSVHTTTKQNDYLTKAEVPENCKDDHNVNQKTLEETVESRKREKSESSDIIIIEDSIECDSEKTKTFTACMVLVSNSEQKLVNNHIDAKNHDLESTKAEKKKPAARVTRSRSDHQSRPVRTPSPRRIISPVFDKTLKRNIKNDNQTLESRSAARTRSEHQRRLRRTSSRSPPRNTKFPRTPPGSPSRGRRTSNSPSRRNKTSRPNCNSPPRRTISPHNLKRTKLSCRPSNHSPNRRARSRSPPRSFRDRGRPRSIDRKRLVAPDRKRSRSRGNDFRERQNRPREEWSRRVEAADRPLKLDRHGNVIETYRDWKNKNQDIALKTKEAEMRISADQELADLFREGGGSETPLFGSEAGSNFDEISLNLSENESEKAFSTNKGKIKEEATTIRTALSMSELSEEELERILQQKQQKLRELSSTSFCTESQLSNVSSADDFVDISHKSLQDTRRVSAELSHEDRKSSSKERTLNDNDLRTKLSKKRLKTKSEEKKSGNKVNQNKNSEEKYDEMEERLYGVNNGATIIQTLYGSMIEEVQKIRVKESELLKNSVSNSSKTSIECALDLQVKESNPAEKCKKKIGIGDYKKRNERKNSAADLQEDQKPASNQNDEQTLELTKQPTDPDNVKETLSVSSVIEKMENTAPLPEKPYQRIRIIEDRVVSCAKIAVKHSDSDKPVATEMDDKATPKDGLNLEVDSNSLPESGQDKGSFLNDFDFSISEDESDEEVEKKRVVTQNIIDVEQNVENAITQESGFDNEAATTVNQKVEKKISVIQSSSSTVTNNPPNHQTLDNNTTVNEVIDQKSNEPEAECIENIQEAIHNSTINPEPATVTSTIQLNVEELQKCLEDGDDSGGAPKNNDVKPKTTREQMILLFGSDSPATPEMKKTTKPRKTEGNKACRNLTNLGEDGTTCINVKASRGQKSEPKKKIENGSFRVRDKALEMKQKPESTELKGEENQKSETTGPVFCNNPNYIPVSPDSRKKLADYIEKQKQDQPDKEENEEELLDETSPSDDKKSSKGYKRKPFKIKMPFPTQDGKKPSKESEPKKKKRPAKPKPKSKSSEPGDDSLVTTIKKMVEAEKKKCTKPKMKKGKSSKKPEQTDPVSPVNQAKPQQECDDSLKEKSLKRITPIKVGEVTGNVLKTSNKRKLINTEEQKPEKIQRLETDSSQTSNHSPLPHMEEMLKHLERKAPPPIDSTLIIKQKTSHVYTKLPRVPSESYPLESFNDNTVNQIHLDSKDVSMLGANERVIFDNIHEYLGDKSLATFDTVDKTVNDNKVKECSSHFDFSNMLHKSVTTSTPFKKIECSKTDDGLATSKVTKTYLTSPLKRDKRRRITIKVVDLPKV